MHQCNQIKSINIIYIQHTQIWNMWKLKKEQITPRMNKMFNHTFDVLFSWKPKSMFEASKLDFLISSDEDVGSSQISMDNVLVMTVLDSLQCFH